MKGNPFVGKLLTWWDGMPEEERMHPLDLQWESKISAMLPPVVWSHKFYDQKKAEKHVRKAVGPIDWMMEVEEESVHKVLIEMGEAFLKRRPDFEWRIPRNPFDQSVALKLRLLSSKFKLALQSPGTATKAAWTARAIRGKVIGPGKDKLTFKDFIEEVTKQEVADTPVPPSLAEELAAMQDLLEGAQLYPMRSKRLAPLGVARRPKLKFNKAVANRPADLVTHMLTPECFAKDKIIWQFSQHVESDERSIRENFPEIERHPALAVRIMDQEKKRPTLVFTYGNFDGSQTVQHYLTDQANPGHPNHLALRMRDVVPSAANKWGAYAALEVVGYLARCGVNRDALRDLVDACDQHIVEEATADAEGHLLWGWWHWLATGEVTGLQKFFGEVFQWRHRYDKAQVQQPSGEWVGDLDLWVGTGLGSMRYHVVNDEVSLEAELMESELNLTLLAVIAWKTNLTHVHPDKATKHPTTLLTLLGFKIATAADEARLENQVRLIYQHWSGSGNQCVFKPVRAGSFYMEDSTVRENMPRLANNAERARVTISDDNLTVKAGMHTKKRFPTWIKEADYELLSFSRPVFILGFDMACLARKGVLGDFVRGRKFVLPVETYLECIEHKDLIDWEDALAMLGRQLTDRPKLLARVVPEGFDLTPTAETDDVSGLSTGDIEVSFRVEDESFVEMVMDSVGFSITDQSEQAKDRQYVATVTSLVDNLSYRVLGGTGARSGFSRPALVSLISRILGDREFPIEPVHPVAGTLLYKVISICVGAAEWSPDGWKAGQLGTLDDDEIREMLTDLRETPPLGNTTYKAWWDVLHAVTLPKQDLQV
jgi:hypothetical protein